MILAEIRAKWRWWRALPGTVGGMTVYNLTAPAASS